MRWWMLPILILIFIPCSIISYFSTNKWFCNFWGWHKSPREQRFNGSSCIGICPRCENEVLQDSNGDWF